MEIIVLIVVFGIAAWLFFREKNSQQKNSEEKIKPSSVDISATRTPTSSSSTPFNPNSNARDAAAFARSLQMSPEERARRARGLD